MTEVLIGERRLGQAAHRTRASECHVLPALLAVDLTEEAVARVRRHLGTA